MVLQYIMGPLIGAVIGYFTNYIAVKMLFFPKKEVRILGHRLPFTPGAIPKGKARLAKAVGGVVSNTLITKDDIAQNLLSEKNALGISDTLKSKLSDPIKSEIMDLTDISEKEYIEKRNKLVELISVQIADAVAGMNLSDILVEKGSEIIKEKVSGNMLKMFLTDDRIQSIIEPVGQEVETLISEQGVDYIRPVVKEKFIEMERQTGLQVLETMDVDEPKIDELVTLIYIKAINAGVGKLMNSIDIAGIVETKINDMSIDTLEEMVLGVMKKELNMIVNLGALIGFLLGLFNLIW